MATVICFDFSDEALRLLAVPAEDEARFVRFARDAGYFPKPAELNHVKYLDPD